jgi:hypothetical protein
MSSWRACRRGGLPWSAYQVQQLTLYSYSSLRVLQATLNAKPERTRWINDLLLQLERVPRKGKKQAVLLLGLCPVGGTPASNFDHVIETFVSSSLCA